MKNLELYLISGRSLKVLKHEEWMEDETVHAYDIPITVNLTRPGRYLYKGFAFYVTKSGKAFLEYGGTSKQFKYDLALLSAEELDHRKVAALEGIVREGLATKKQKQLWIMCLNAEMSRQSYRQSKLHRRKRLRALNNARS